MKLRKLPAHLGAPLLFRFPISFLFSSILRHRTALTETESIRSERAHSLPPRIARVEREAGKTSTLWKRDNFPSRGKSPTSPPRPVRRCKTEGRAGLRAKKKHTPELTSLVTPASFPPPPGARGSTQPAGGARWASGRGPSPRRRPTLTLAWWA